MSIRLWFKHKKYTIKTWLKELWIANRLRLLAVVSTLLVIAGAWVFTFKWLETEILKVQWPETKLEIIHEVKAAKLVEEVKPIVEVKEDKPVVKAKPAPKQAAGVHRFAHDPNRDILVKYAKEYKISDANIQLLIRIVQAEAGWGHYKTDGKTVKFNATKDIGFCQINQTYHAARAKKMGLDLFKPNDNLNYCAWLFSTGGAGHWNASKHRDNKTGWGDYTSHYEF